MASFQAPTNEDGLPPILPSTRGIQRRLFRFYRPRPEGINVYIYSDDTVSEDDPNGSERVWTIHDINVDNPNAAYVTHVFWGGHEADPITDEEATLLTAAGYEVIP